MRMIRVAGEKNPIANSNRLINWPLIRWNSRLSLARSGNDAIRIQISAQAKARLRSRRKKFSLSNIALGVSARIPNLRPERTEISQREQINQLANYLRGKQRSWSKSSMGLSFKQIHLFSWQILSGFEQSYFDSHLCSGGCWFWSWVSFLWGSTITIFFSKL